VGYGSGGGNRDLGSFISSSTPSRPSSTGFDAIHGISEIGSLPGSDHARRLLQQLCHEFGPVVRSRGWSVGKVVEMCCCNSNNSNITTRPPPNDAVRGYCVASGNGRTAHSIHIRLRPSGSCQSFQHHFYPYNSLVQTMAHELAHVKIQAHNDAFFKLMAELEAERVQSLVNASSSNNNHFSMTISSGRRLGGASSSGGMSPVIGSQDLKRMVAMAAVKRKKIQSSNKKKQSKLDEG
jgi:WLM domain